MVWLRILLLLVSTKALAFNPEFDEFFKDFHNLTETFYGIGGDAHNSSLAFQNFLLFIEKNYPDLLGNLSKLADMPAAMRDSSDTLATAFNAVQIAFYVWASCYLVNAGMKFIPKVWAYCADREPYARD
jgi:hypothetical protein